jgi:hypothetical protein
MKNKKLKWAVVILIVALLLPSCKGKAGAQTGGGKSINSATELKEYLDKQLVNSPDKPIKIAMKANDVIIKNIGTVIKEAGKYVSLDLSGSPLTEIPDQAFFECTPLANIIIPNSVISIGRAAFWSCSSLTNITIPNSVTSIGDSAFESSKLESITIPSSITDIEKETFSYCTSLTNITIPNSVTNIGHYAFFECTSLTSVTFESTITPNNFSKSDPFPGDLRTKYLAGGVGTYTTTVPVQWNSKWTKQ